MLGASFDTPAENTVFVFAPAALGLVIGLAARGTVKPLVIVTVIGLLFVVISVG